METPKYVPARVKKFLSSLHVQVADPFLLTQGAYSSKRTQYEQYAHRLPNFLDTFFEGVLQAGKVSDEEKRLIESVWLDDVLPVNIPKPALEIFERLARSEEVRGKLDSILEDIDSKIP